MRQTWTFPLRINSEPICTMFSVQRVSVHLSHLAHFLSINKCRWLPEFQMLLLAVLLSLPDSGAEKTDAVLSILYTLYSSKDFPTAVVLTMLCLPGFNSTVCLLLWSPCLEQATSFLMADPLGMSADFVSQHCKALQTIRWDPSEAWILYLLPDIFTSVMLSAKILRLMPLSFL